MKGELRSRGPNSISKFDHHNLNGGAAVNDTFRVRPLFGFKSILADPDIGKQVPNSIKKNVSININDK
jgi:hypothetical protein